MTTSIIFSIVIKLAAGTSLKKIWSLLLCLQLHLFCVLQFSQPQYSAYLMTCCDQLESIIKLKFIPKEYIVRHYISPTIEESKVQQAFWIAIPILLVLILALIITLAFMFKKVQKVRQSMMNIKKKFMWNSIIQSVLIGYLGYSTTFVLDLKQRLYPIFFPHFSEIKPKSFSIEPSTIAMGLVAFGFAIFVRLKVRANR